MERLYDAPVQHQTPFNLEQITQLYAIAVIHQNNMVVPSVIGAAEN
jgi:hypothetical protein